MGFTGSGNLKIKNVTGGEIKNVRVTHLLKGEDCAKDYEFVTIDSLPDHGSSPKRYTFHSVNGKDDHWCVTFENSNGCWLCDDLDMSMKADFISDSYLLIIEEKTLTFYAKNKNGHSEIRSKETTTVYDAIQN